MPSKKKNEITKVSAPAGLPAHLQQYAETDTSLAVLQQYRTVPRVKLIQPTTARELKELHGEGSAILRPGDVLLTDKDNAVKLVPVGFYVEFAKWSDLKDQESPAIVERSFDQDGELAQRSRSQELRFETYEGEAGKEKPRKYRYVEHRIFICVVYEPDHPLHGEVIAVDFSRGEFGTGANFINACAMRKTPLWSQIWEFVPGFREKGEDKKWWGFDITAPSADPIENHVTEEETEFFQALNEEWVQVINDRLVRVDHEDDYEDEGASGVDGSKF